MARSSSPPICDLDTPIPPVPSGGERVCVRDGVGISRTVREPGVIGPLATRVAQIWLTDEPARWEARTSSRSVAGLEEPAVLVVPPEMTFCVEWRRSAPLCVLRVAPTLAAELGGGALDFQVTPLSRHEVREPLIAALVATLQRDLLNPQLPGTGVTLLAGGLAARLLPLLTTGHDEPEPARRILGEESLRRIETYVDAKLTDRLPTEVIAREVGLGASRFRILLKATLGLTPEQYVLRRRLLRARALIESGRQTIGEVAHAVGFADHSHLTVRFRAFFGVAPRSLLPSVRRR